MENMQRSIGPQWTRFALGQFDGHLTPRSPPGPTPDIFAETMGLRFDKLGNVHSDSGFLASVKD